ncbi:MAG: hypothetical protein KF718_33320 [Polyangiaceae bacterium]|nr:hypothetical protein [Polyangiaceae bacterium]
MTTYRGYFERLLPGWMRGHWGSRYLYPFGLVLDAIMQATSDAVRVRFLTNAPDDALGELGLDSALERYPADSPAGHLTRMQKRFSTWRRAGSRQSLSDQLQAFGFPWVTLYSARALGVEIPDWSRFWTVAQDAHGWDWPSWDEVDPVTGNVIAWDAFVWDQFVSPGGVVLDLETSLRRLVRKFKSAHERCVEILVLHTNTTPRWDHPGPLNLCWDDFVWDAGKVALFKG